jgi:NADH-quinone oxidoreductase subunit F
MEKPLTGRIKPGEGPVDLKTYERTGGYQALRKALDRMTPEAVTHEVRDAKLRGRGGAGFSTGGKWSFVPMGEDAPGPRYLAVNGDEMEPGTFKDRVILEGDPHSLLEGVLLACYAIQAERAYVFIRWAYKEAIGRVKRAIDEAREAGYVGKNILGSGFDVDVAVHESAGRYMCGEETGLLNAVEGRRATPRAKPPYPPVIGLFGRPTVVNNVETLSCVPHIIRNGAEWFRKLGRSEAGSGTKLYGVSGKVKRPGIFELPSGTPMREILEEHAGGMREGLKLRGLLPGGASTAFVIEQHLDTPMDFDSMQKTGSRMGTGTLIVLDDRTCPVGMVLNLQHFFAQESCGWCTPCRDGLPWVEKTLRAVEHGEGRPEDLEILELHARYLGPGFTFCALAPGAVDPLRSALQ